MHERERNHSSMKVASVLQYKQSFSCAGEDPLALYTL